MLPVGLFRDDAHEILLRLFPEPLGAEEIPPGLAFYLLGLIAERQLGRTVDEPDGAVKVHAQDDVVGRLDETSVEFFRGHQDPLSLIEQESQDYGYDHEESTEKNLRVQIPDKAPDEVPVVPGKPHDEIGGKHVLEDEEPPVIRELCIRENEGSLEP